MIIRYFAGKKRQRVVTRGAFLIKKSHESVFKIARKHFFANAQKRQPGTQKIKLLPRKLQAPYIILHETVLDYLIGISIENTNYVETY